jgi:two-component system, OmpR family, response regulator QseB
MSVLLVEDDPLLGEGVRHALSREGHSVTWAKDGEEALAAAATQTYSCILLDLRMPQLSGLAVLKRLRAQGDRTPVIIVTASELPGQKIEGLDAGADDYLVKPFDLEELLASALKFVGSTIAPATSSPPPTSASISPRAPPP